MAEWRETNSETHRTHAHGERWRGTNITHFAELFTPGPYDFTYKKKMHQVNIYIYFFTLLLCRDNLMHPRLFVTSSDSVETRPISCQSSQIQTLYSLSWSRKWPYWLAEIIGMHQIEPCGIKTAGQTLFLVYSHCFFFFYCIYLCLCLCRQENVAELLKNMFEGERTEASVVNGTQVLLTLLESRRSGWVQPLEGLIKLKINSCSRSLAVVSFFFF